MLRKYHSRVYEEALIRYKNIKAMCLELGLEKTIPLDEFEKELNNFGELQIDYNLTKALLDGKHANIISSENKLRSTNEKMLLKIAVTFGKNSKEYVRAGGKRKVDRKKVVNKSPKKSVKD